MSPIICDHTLCESVLISTTPCYSSNSVCLNNQCVWNNEQFVFMTWLPVYYCVHVNYHIKTITVLLRKSDCANCIVVAVHRGRWVHF